MEKSTREKLIIATIILLLPCLFYKNDDKKTTEQKIKTIEVQQQENVPQVMDSMPQTTLAVNYGNNQVPAEPNIYPAVQNNVSKATDIPANYNYVKDNVQKTSQPTVAENTALEGEDYISTDNYANPKLKYYYYIPSSLLKNKTLSHSLIVAVPGLSGDGKGFVPQEMKDFAQKEGFGIVAPTFIEDTANFDSQKSYQYPAAWSGDAMIRIINDLKSREFKYSKLYMFGFSAGAQFSSRFSLIHPEMTAACSLNGNGARVWPETNNGVKYFIGIGTQDDPFRKENAEIFYKAARQLNIPIEYKQYNEGHTYSQEQILDGLNFFKKVKNSQI